MKRLFLIFAVLVVASVSASAAPVFLTPAQLASFALLSSTGVPAPAAFNNLTGGGYSVQWGPAASGAYSATSGVSGLSIGGTGDVFTLIVTNNNGSPWSFSASIVDSGGTHTSAIFSVPNGGGTHAFSFTLNGPLTAVNIIVSGTLPIGGTDRGAEYILTSAPEPTSMLLLGTGLLGVAGAFRRRFTARS